MTLLWSPTPRPALSRPIDAEGAADSPPVGSARTFTPLFKVFWAAGGDVWFRDERDWKQPLRGRLAKMTFWRLGHECRAARGSERIALSRIHAELETALAEARMWKAAGSPAPLIGGGE